MNQHEQLDSIPIEPIYSQDAPSDPIEFGTVAVRFTHNNQTYHATATVKLRFVPTARLVFIISDETLIAQVGFALIGGTAWNGKLWLVDRGVEIDVFCIAVGDEGIVFVPRTSGVRVTPHSPELSVAQFHVFNLPELHGPDSYALKTGQPPQHGWKSCGRVILRANGWKITIAATGDTSDLVKALKEQGGYLITHVGEIQREDGSLFTSEQLENELEAITYFLSFAFGRWTAPALSVGSNPDGERVYEEWGLRRTSDGMWSASFSWFDAQHAGLLSEVYPGFQILWESELWSIPLNRAIYLYLEASGPGKGVSVDTGLILAQAALELLAWNYAVRQKRLVSANGFGSRALSAHDKLRMLASSLDIPLEVPEATPCLQTIKKEDHDSLHVITDLRNSVVHPNVNIDAQDDRFYESWKLSMWFLDLVLLRLFGHAGHYSNRLTASHTGQVELVPWAEP